MLRPDMRILLCPALILTFSLPARAQVEKVAIRTTGISCGSCAIFSEVYLKELPGVDKITISLSKEAVMITYKPGAAFRPQELREALKRTAVGVVQMQIDALGHMERRPNETIFVAGRDVFKVASLPALATIPPGVPLAIESVVNDLANPMELKILTFRLVAPK